MKKLWFLIFILSFLQLPAQEKSDGFLKMLYNDRIKNIQPKTEDINGNKVFPLRITRESFKDHFGINSEDPDPKIRALVN